MNHYEIEHLKTLRPLLSECVVLLKKDGKFPLTQPCKIAAYGEGVRHTIKGGTGSGEVNSRYFITVEQALKDEGFEIVTGSWLNDYDAVLEKTKEDFLKQLKKEAKEKHQNAIMYGMGKVAPAPDYELDLRDDCDTAIYVLARLSGEGNDRVDAAGDLQLSKAEIRDILALNETHDKFMLVLNVGGPVDLEPVKDVKNILVLSQLGVETGCTLTDILLGKTYPSGKLTSTWATADDYCKIGEFGQWDDTRYSEGIYVGYRYFDTAKIEPLFPFGYGLSYSEFSIEQETLSLEKDRVSVSCKVKNIGNFTGKEVIEVYVSTPTGKLDKAYQDLAGYQKTKELKPDESCDVDIQFSMKELASYDSEKSQYVLEKGDYYVRVGNSSRNTKVIGKIFVNEDVVVRQVKKCLGDVDFKDYVIERESDNYDVKGWLLDEKGIDTETINYEINEPIEPQIHALSDEDLCKLNMGNYGMGIAGVIGDASSTVCGAAGETAHLDTLDGEPLIFADGPAGIRIAAQYYEDAKGKHAYGPTIPTTILQYMPKLLQKIMGGMPKLKEGTVLKEQYCTAIPVGTAIAQSFNTDLAETCGDLVGNEMGLFNVDIWLAPALNIHRSPLCGRNFEYYSEDPLISGKVAAAVVRGVQKHKNRYATIKHFAFNNQETNRYTSNSMVSERAAREIYLKGFEICIKEAKPVCLMTSYNLVNGIHTNESRDLCFDILRCEFGFDSVIMTDWEISAMAAMSKSKYRMPKADECAKAANNLYMPGSAGDYKQLVKGYKNGVVDRKQLEINASYTYRLLKTKQEKK